MKFTSLVVVLGYLLLTVNSLPGPTRHPNTREKCHSVSKYSVEWFINNAPRAQKPKHSTCLFYTHHLSATARNYAKKKANPPLTTIWDVWPGGYYNQKLVQHNPLRCIMRNNDTERVTYFSHMSQAFASLCNGEATVMDKSINARNKHFNVVNKSGIWFKIEFPRLQRGYLKKNIVDSIKAISPDGLYSFYYWKRSGFGGQVRSNSGSNRKRGVQEILSDSVNMIKDTAGKVSDSYDSFVESGFDAWWDEDVVFDDIDYEDWSLG